MAVEERTEPATPRRRQEARKRGQVGRSPEIGSALVLLFGFVVLWIYGPYAYTYLQTYMRWAYSPVVLVNLHLNDANVAYLFIDMFFFCARILAPLVIVLIIIGLLSNISQVGFVFSFHPLLPNLTKLDPIQGMKRMLSMRSLQELVKSLLKIAVVGSIAYVSIIGALHDFVLMMDMDIAASMAMVGRLVVSLSLKVALALLLLAFLDFIYQKFEFEKSIRMTKQEVKDEYKQREGDPLVRSRIRQRQREIAMRRMMREVPTADVVITNPVFLAIALRYVADEMHAPKVVAKGAGQIAERIREIAVENDVPIMVDPPLAQSLFKLTDVDDFIPPTLFKAVAEILAYVYRLGKKAHSFGL
ncbi:MAG: flagellar biosynthesis protein FlhB [bacterium]